MPLHPIDTVILPNLAPENDTIRETILKLQESREVARQNIIESQEKMKERYDKTANPISFEPGDLVWIYFPKIVVGGSKKFFHKYSGPYILLSKTSPTNFEVAHAHNNQKLRNEIHVNRMKRFHHRSIAPPPPSADEILGGSDHEDVDLHPNVQTGDNQIQAPVPQLNVPVEQPISQQPSDLGRNLQPSTSGTLEIANYKLPTPPNFTDSPQTVEEYEINKIIHARARKDKTLEYLIDWKGYPNSDRSYEP